MGSRTLHYWWHHVGHLTGRAFIGISHNGLAVRVHRRTIRGSVLVVQIGRWICTWSGHRVVVFSRVRITTGSPTVVGPRGRRIVGSCCRIKLAGRWVMTGRIHRRRNLFVEVLLRVVLARVNGVSSMGTHHMGYTGVTPRGTSCSTSILMRHIGALRSALRVCWPIIVRILPIIGVGRHWTSCIRVVIIVGCRTRIKIGVVVFVLVLSITLTRTAVLNLRCLCLV